MRDFRDAKAMAQSLRRALTAKTVSVTHSESLELIAKAFGLDNWNILAARIEPERPPPSVATAEDGAETLHCSFCSKSQHEVAALIAGPGVFICDACVGLCDNIIEDQVIDRALREFPDRDPFAATVEIMRRKTDDQLSSYRTGGESWRDHLLWSLRQTDDALARLKSGAPWIPDARAMGRGWTRDPLHGKSREDIDAHRVSLAASLRRVDDRLRAVEAVYRERAAP